MKDFTPNSGTARLDLTSPSIVVGFAGRIEKGALRCAGEEGLQLTARSLDVLLAHRLAPLLPSGTKLALTGNDPIRLSVRELSLPLPELSAAAPGGVPSASLTMAEGLAGKVDLVVPGVSFSDEHTRAAKIEPVLRALTLGVEIVPKKPLVAKLSADVEAGEKGKLDASLSVDDPWWVLRGADAKMPPVDAHVKLAGIPTTALDVLAGKSGMISKLLGARLDLDVSAERASLEGGALRAEVHAPSADVSFAGRLDKGRLLCSGKEGLGVTLTIPQGWLDAQIVPLLPAGTVLTLQDAASPLKLDVREIAIALPAPAAADPAAAPAPGDSTKEMLALVSKLAIKLDLSVPDFAYSDPRIAASAAAPPGGQPIPSGAQPVPAGAPKPGTAPTATTTPVAAPPASALPSGPPIVRGFRLHAELSSSAPPSASLRASIEGDPRGELACTLRALDPLGLLAEDKGLDRFRVAADVHASKVPTGLVDALAGQDGLLVDTLGPRLDLVLTTDSISLSAGNFTADLASNQATLHVDRGSLQDGALVLEKTTGKNEALLARIGLTPLASERVVGNLVPMAVDIRKPAGGDPVVLAVDGLHMPIDGDLSKLDAVVRLNLGEVSYQLLPGLASVLGGGEAKLVRMPELRVPIQKGVASYDGLPLRIGGHDYAFKGTFSLVDKTFKLGTGVPLAALGKKFNKELDSAREFLSPDLVVPLEISGNWKHPKVGIADEFMKKVVEDALKKQTGNLLDDLLKKKDKKKKD